MGKITASRTTLRPDPKFNSLLASKFINCLMYDGKKTTAQKVFYDALDEIGAKVKDRPPIEVFETALENVKPYIEVRSQARRWCLVSSADASESHSSAIAGHSLGAASGARQEGSCDPPETGRRSPGRFPQGRRRDEQTRKDAPHGRRQQGVLSLRLVVWLIETTQSHGPLYWSRGSFSALT